MAYDEQFRINSHLKVRHSYIFIYLLFFQQPTPASIPSDWRSRLCVWKGLLTRNVGVRQRVFRQRLLLIFIVSVVHLFKQVESCTLLERGTYRGPKIHSPSGMHQWILKRLLREIKRANCLRSANGAPEPNNQQPAQAGLSESKVVEVSSNKLTRINIWCRGTSCETGWLMNAAPGGHIGNPIQPSSPPVPARWPSAIRPIEDQRWSLRCAKSPMKKWKSDARKRLKGKAWLQFDWPILRRKELSGGGVVVFGWLTSHRLRGFRFAFDPDSPIVRVHLCRGGPCSLPSKQLSFSVPF